MATRKMRQPVTCRYSGSCERCGRKEECQEIAWNYLGSRCHKADLQMLEEAGHAEWLTDQYLVRELITISPTPAELVKQAHEKAGYYKPTQVHARKIQRRAGKRQRAKERRALNNTRVLTHGLKATVLRGKKELPALITVRAGYAIIEPTENGNAAYMIDAKDVGKQIDLNEIDHIRIIHNKGGIKAIEAAI